MGSQFRWARPALGSVLALVCAAACANVLDIQDPKPRPTDAGAAGETAEPSAGTATGGSSTGANPLTPGAAGQGGVAEPGGAGSGGEAGATPTAGAGGEGGTPSGECTPDEGRCIGDAEKTPEICDETGHWVANPDEADGDCANACLNGKCVECNESDPPQCKDCSDGAADCNSNQRQTCVDGVWTDDGDACEQFCEKGSCETAPSCGPTFKVRTTCQVNVSCCESLRVPGGTFNRYIEEDFETPYPATISAFYLDKFEVTVGRFRQFVQNYEQFKPTLKDGDGKSSHITDDSGWSTSYALPLDQAALLNQLKGEAPDSTACDQPTWVDTAGQNNDLPINCVTFNLAYAFCIWDGGRLPTEAEWEFAAAGGEAQRAYPWKAPDTGPPITPEYANYDSEGPIAVGSMPIGNGRWGQADMAGNVAEWTMDYYGDYPPTCIDCLNTTVASWRTERGGAYALSDYGALVSTRDYFDPLAPRAFIGFRCARDLE